jgi:hypothetical protein
MKKPVLKLAAKPTGNADQALPHAPLTQVNQALESSRDAGFDLSAAVGELIDNSYEAKARHIRIATTRDEEGSIVELAVADDGTGIAKNVLAAVLSLGFSTRYGSRTGFGRFGMGLKLASLSQAMRVEVFTRGRGETEIYATYLDLEKVRDGTQKDLRVVKRKGFPQAFAGLMQDLQRGRPFRTGTMVVWRKIDRLQQGGRFGNSIEERLQELKKFIARAYRRFINDGLKIDFDGQPITLHDPTFLLDNPRVTEKFKKNLRAAKVDGGEFTIDGSTVKWVVTLLPEQLRRIRGAGARATKGREEFADLYIPENESKISILRNGREIYYDVVPKLYPAGRDIVDRFIGVEIEFPATLDEYFQVRNVKRGAEPVSKLRQEIRKAVEKPIKDARKQIRRFWREVEQEEANKSGDAHLPAHQAGEGFDQTAPAGQANLDADQKEIDEAIEKVIEDLGLDPGDPASAEKAEWVRESFKNRAVTLVDGDWPGKELLDIRHLTGKAIVRLNLRHPFMSEFVMPAKRMAEIDPEELDPQEVSGQLKRLQLAIDLLLLAYAKAENMHPDPDEVYSDLRSHWGLFTAGLVREALKQGA